MVRTQVYITEKERKFLSRMSKQTGKSQSELIRDAIDFFSHHKSDDNRIALLRSAKGIWEDRDDFANFESFRKELDRDLGEGE